MLDEADQLLHTERTARLEAARRQQVATQGRPLSARQRAHIKHRHEASATELLLQELPRPLGKLQLICASATVGRSLRRQVQGMLGAPSIDKASELVALADRDDKRASARRSALMPSTLQHAYVLLPPRSAPLDGPDGPPDTAAAGGSSRTSEGDAAEAETAARMGALGDEARTRPERADGQDTHAEESAEGADAANEAGAVDEAGAVSDDDLTANAAEHLLDGLWTAMQRIDPAPTIIFAGRAGVSTIRDALQARGLQRVHLLRDVAEDDSAARASAADAPPRADSPGPPAADWTHTDVFVGSERWGRGLDLDVDYVFLLAPPANSASYAHLAGRTARRGKPGTAITILGHKHAPRMVAFAEALGITVAPLC